MSTLLSHFDLDANGDLQPVLAGTGIKGLFEKDGNADIQPLSYFAQDLYFELDTNANINPKYGSGTPQVGFGEVENADYYRIRITTNYSINNNLESSLNYTNNSTQKLENTIYDEKKVIFDKEFDGSESWATIENNEVTLDFTDIKEIFENNTIYYWKIKSINSSGESVWSETRTLLTIREPNKPIITNPINDSITNRNFLVTWKIEDISDYFEMEIASDISFTTIILNKYINYNYYRSNRYDFGTDYYIRVRAISPHLTGEWSDTIHITTKTELPSVPTIDFPDNFDVIDI